MKEVSLNTQTFFKRAVGVAEHYGFCNVEDLNATPARKPSGIGLHAHERPEEQFDRQALNNTLVQLAEAVELRKRPSLMFYTPAVVTHPSSPQVRISTLTLNAVGSNDPLAEIILIKSAISVLSELGIKDVRVRVNSIGDNDSSARFMREVGGQLKHRARELPSEYADMLRSDIASTVAHLYEQRHAVTADLPSPLDFLTSPSRKYFKEVLELLEETKVPFDLDDRLYGNHSMYAHTLFEIVEAPNNEDTADEPAVLARGGRYDNLTRTYARCTVPAAGVVLAFRTKNACTNVGRPRHKKPRACLIHLGREARIKSIEILERFRKEKIPIQQCLQYERFSEQIAYAEAHGTKHIIILGQREVHQNIVIVRNAHDRSQCTVPIDLLPTYFQAAV